MFGLAVHSQIPFSDLNLRCGNAMVPISHLGRWFSWSKNVWPAVSWRSSEQEGGEEQWESRRRRGRGWHLQFHIPESRKKTVGDSELGFRGEVRTGISSQESLARGHTISVWTMNDTVGKNESQGSWSLESQGRAVCLPPWVVPAGQVRRMLLDEGEGG